MSFKYQAICSNLLKDLPQRTNNVVERRFGLKTGNSETLEFIGKDYNITRERVRQIEEEGFSRVKSKAEKYNKIFQHFNKTLDSFGGVKKESVLLAHLGGEKYQNQVLFLLSLTDNFYRRAEDKDFYSLWAKEEKILESAKKAVGLAISSLEEENKPLTIEELFNIHKPGFYKILGNKANKNVVSSILEISKKIQENRDNQLGLRHWVEINPKGIKDKAYLVLRKEGQPLHFSKVAVLIESSPFFNSRKVHTATVHNELIKDSRFVLVGRGLYGLREWGYEPGVVKDVILNVLKSAKKPLAKEEIIKEVSSQRIVKANTILLNLQDKNCFSKDSQGRYFVNNA